MGRASGKVAFVTGGSRGIGQATAQLLAAEGADVVITGTDRERGEKAAQAMAYYGNRAVFLKHNVGNEAEWQESMDRTLERFGKLNVLVNNAAIFFGGSVEQTTLQDWRRLMSINLDGVFLGIKYGIQAIRKNSDGGSIVNLSSISGKVAHSLIPAYCASKGGVGMLTKSAALHCAEQGYNIRVNSVHPGLVWTDMGKQVASLVAHGDEEEGRQALEELYPTGCLVEKTDVAQAVLYLASDDSKSVTGAELVIDGGYLAS